jgi:hypothetical protein
VRVAVGVSGVTVASSGVSVGVGVGVFVAVSVGVLVGVLVLVGVFVAVFVGVFVGVFVAVFVGVLVGFPTVFVGVFVGFDAVLVGVLFGRQPSAPSGRDMKNSPTATSAATARRNPMVCARPGPRNGLMAASYRALRLRSSPASRRLPSPSLALGPAGRSSTGLLGLAVFLCASGAAPPLDAESFR